MTKKEKENITRWNIETGKADKEKELYFSMLQALCKKNNLGVYCSVEDNLTSILLSNATEKDKSNAVLYFGKYHEACGQWDTLISFLSIVGNC